MLVGWPLLTARQSGPETTATDTVVIPKQSAMRFLPPEIKPDEAVPDRTAPEPPAPPETLSRQISRNAQLQFRVSDLAVAGRVAGQSVDWCILPAATGNNRRLYYLADYPVASSATVGIVPVSPTKKSPVMPGRGLFG